MMAMRRLTLLSVTMLAPLLGAVGRAQAEELPPVPIITQVATDDRAVDGVADPAVPVTVAEPASEVRPKREKYPLLPIGGRAAIERGYHIQRALGASGMLIHNVQNMSSRNLAIAIAKGEDPPEGGPLLEVPFVTTTQMESHSSNSEFKADVWLFPFLNLFAGIGKVKGHVNVGVDIDLDAFVPFPFCRPAKPCGHTQLPFKADIDNSSFTFGSILGYGSDSWFAALSLAKTISVAKKDRSDMQMTNIAARAGPRFSLGGDTILTPYVGANYFDMDVTVSGLVRSGALFEDGDSVGLRYKVDLSSRHPWAGIAGANLELSSHWAMQAEYNLGQESNRFVLSLTFRP
ncbi:Outer membrane protein beta-barrel domain-containing protein OS=Sphingobium scionense OX=1404341 GN=GGQ90_002519 PE=4 SV=1 [Sphingobium scionense]